jgi:predicted dehydrogenase
VNQALRAAVIGTGIGEQHLEALAAEPGVEVVAICARTEASAQRLAQRHDVARAYSSYERLLEEQAPALVVVATPNNLHHEMALASLEAGAHVICEKPLGMTYAQAAELAERADALGRRHLAAFTWHFLPGARRMKSLLDDGAVGRVYQVQARYHVRGWGDPSGPMRWQFDAAVAGSGAVANLGSHLIHLIDWWLGDFEAVCAQLTTAVPERRGEAGPVAVTVDDTCGLLARLSSGVPVALSLSSVAFGPRVSVEIGVYGSAGALLFSDDWNAPHAATGRILRAGEGDEGWSEVPIPGAGAQPAAGVSPLSGCFAGMAAEMAAAIREQRAAAPGFHDGARVQAVLDATTASAADSRWVSTADVRASRASAQPRSEGVPA